MISFFKRIFATCAILSMVLNLPVHAFADTPDPLAVTINPIGVTDHRYPELTGTINDPFADVLIEVVNYSYLMAINNGDGTWIVPAGSFGPLPNHETFHIIVMAYKYDEEWNLIGEAGAEADFSVSQERMPKPEILGNSDLNQDNMGNYSVVGKTEPDTQFVHGLFSDNFRPSLEAIAFPDWNGDFRFDQDEGLAGLLGFWDGPISAEFIAIGQEVSDSEPTIVTINKDTSDLPEPDLTTPTLISSANVINFPISGDAWTNAELHYHAVDKNGNRIEGSKPTVGTGSFSFNLDLSALADGPIGLYFGQSFPGDFSSLLHTQLPKDTSVVNLNLLISDDYVNSLNASDFAVSGETKPDSTVSWLVTDQNDLKIGGEIQSTTEGIFDLHLDLSTLADGNLNFEFFATDTFGNKSETFTLTKQKETIAPEAPALLTNPFINLGNQSSFPISGTTEASASVILKAVDIEDKEKTLSETADSAGHFSGSIDLSDFAEGIVNFSAYSIDSFNNEGAVASKQVEKDTISPSIGYLDAGEVINIYNLPNYLIGGFTNPLTDIDFELQGDKNLSAITTSNDEGKFSLDLSSLVSQLADGWFRITATCRDLAGNFSSSILDVFKDTTPPVINPSGLDLINSKNQADYHFSGWTEPNSTVAYRLWDDGSFEISELVFADGRGHFEGTVNLTEALDGPIHLSYLPVDYQGNDGELVFFEIEKHAAIPEEPTNLSLKGLENPGASVLSLSGKTDPDCRISYSIRDKNGKTISGEISPEQDGDFSIENLDVAALASGELLLSLRTVDSFGNESSPCEVTMVKSAPVEIKADVQVTDKKTSNTNLDSLITATFTSSDPAVTSSTFSSVSANPAPTGTSNELPSAGGELSIVFAILSGFALGLRKKFSKNF